MKEGRRAGGITAGPESEVLKGGASWEEAAEAVRAASAGGGYFGGGVDGVTVGAASKGIIQRDYQHHATVYKSPYAKNPFDNISAEELQEYKRIIDSKNRNDQGESSPFFIQLINKSLKQAFFSTSAKNPQGCKSSKLR